MKRSTAVLKDLIGTDVDWQELARCRQADPEQWYPEKGGATSAAIRVCGRCPVRVECLEYALGRREVWGIWGGTTEQQRRRMLGVSVATAA